MRESASLAAGFLLKATREMLEKFRPGENYAGWYVREIRQAYDRLANTPVVENAMEN